LRNADPFPDHLPWVAVEREYASGGFVLHLTTATLVRIGAVVIAVASVVAAIGGWVGLDVIETSLTLAPELGEAGEPSQGLVAAVDETLNEVRGGLQTLRSITDQVAASTEEAADVLDEVGALSTGRIPDALASLEAALPALIDTAAVIDNTMRTLSVLGVDYRPQVPLDEAFGDVQTQLDGLPETINQQGENLQTLVEEMRGMGTETGLLSGQIDSIERNLADTQATLSDYGQAVDSLGRLTELSDQIEASIPVGRVALVVLALSGLILGAIGWHLGSRLTG
jgi:methyl-accepting chemotaxis protein